MLTLNNWDDKIVDKTHVKITQIKIKYRYIYDI